MRRILFYNINRTNTTYLENSTFDGILESNSRFFDESLGSNMLVIKANTGPFQSLRGNCKHSHCLSLLYFRKMMSDVHFQIFRREVDYTQTCLNGIVNRLSITIAYYTVWKQLSPEAILVYTRVVWRVLLKDKINDMQMGKVLLY